MTSWHQLPADEALAAQQTTPEGLSVSPDMDQTG